MKTLSKIRQQNREEFEKGFSNLAKLWGMPAIGDNLKDFFSSAESRLLEVILEKIEGMLILENHPISYSAKIIHGERADGLEEGYNRALSDLKAYIQEGMKENRP